MKFREAIAVHQSASGVRFLASCLDELLYEYTSATYKPRVMSAMSLALEAISMIEKAEAGSVDRARLPPILDELTLTLQGDAVAKRLLPFPSSYFTSLNKDSKLRDLRVRMGLLVNRLSDGRYITAVQHDLIRVCQSDKEKAEIRFLARSWVSALLADGYSKQFIATRVNAAFYANEVKFASSGDLAEFFRQFDSSGRSFNVFFAASGMVDEASIPARKFRLSVLQRDDSQISDGMVSKLVTDKLERVVLVEGVRAQDAFAAKLQAEKMLEHLSDLFALFHHKRKIEWSTDAVVHGENSLATYVLPRASSVKRSRDNVPRKASQKLADVVKDLTFSDQDSIGRFISVVRLHGAAQEATSAEAQLVNLWTGMEVLVPRESDSKLRGVLKLITPFLVYGYFDRIMYSLAGDLYRWDRKGVSKIARMVDLPDWRQHQKIAAILLGGKFERQRDDLYALISGYPLLLNRCFEVSKAMERRDKLEARVAAHEQRVVWQVERIYRARNAIVHDGAAPSEVDALAENAHEYLDSFIDRFLILCASQKYVTSLDEAIEYQSTVYANWRKELRTKEDVSIENICGVCALG